MWSSGGSTTTFYLCYQVYVTNSISLTTLTIFATIHQACSSQDTGKCTNEGPACAIKADSTNLLECSTPVGGHWLDQGIATSCTTQTGCETDDTNTCTTGTDVTKYKCLTLKAGYYVADDTGLATVRWLGVQ